MSARVTEHTRTRGEGRCRACKGPIRPGERYRQLVAINEEAFDGDYVRETAHTACVSGSEWWELRDSEAPASRNETLTWVRSQYGEGYRVGAACTVNGKAAHVYNGRHGYVGVKFPGDRHERLYHPREVVLGASA